MTSLEKAKETLNKNQYPATFYNPIIEETLKKIEEAAVQPEVPQQTTANPTPAPEPSAPIARGEGPSHTSHHNSKNQNFR